MLISRAQQSDKELLTLFKGVQKAFAEKGNEVMVGWMQPFIDALTKKITTHDYAKDEEVLSRWAKYDRTWKNLSNHQSGGTMSAC